MLETYWPQAAAINACIKNEAETADVSVLLAVHQPSPIAQRNAGTDIVTPATEKDLLDAFLTDNVPGGALLVPITGPSGVGKSHIVRWLDAQLQRSAKRDQFHIIRIPKSASLRTVVELILEPLADDPRYAKSRDDLRRAVAEVNVNDAVITFRAHLENALSARRDAMMAELRQHPEKTQLKPLIGHADMLPRLFSDAALDRHFIDTVLSRVVARALRGRSESDDDEETLSQFTADDLVLPKSVDLNQTARRVHDYYQRNIAIVGPDRLQPVVDLLNDAVDPAIGNVFQLEQNTGGMTLQDIILAVRETLMEDGKDLVLLVEDFAALAGIQEVLLKVCIYEGERDGKKVRATMRTAMALTDGYLAFRDTILTRAQREWVIGGRPQSDEEIKAGVVEMAGAYLNAARWGDGELRRLFKQQSPEQSLTDWLPAWRDEGASEAESEAVAAFGYDAKGNALFPFNRQAVEQLAERHLSQGGRLVFNPRRVINEILRNTLLMRQAFEAHGFPPAGFQDARPNATLATWIRQTHQSEPVSRRLSTMLAIWGGNPVDTASIAHLPPAIFTTFSLPTPADLANIEFVPEPARPTLTAPSAGGLPGGTDTAPAVAAAVAQEKEDPAITRWRTTLDAWAEGTPLGQTEARELRNALAEMLKAAIDWPSLRLRAVDLKTAWINIPGARGNPPSGRQLNVCESERDDDGTVRAGLLGVIRFSNFNGKRWSYPEADIDYVAATALVDHLLAQLKPMLVEDAKAQASTLGKTLITQSRIAGLAPPIRPSGADAVLTGLFAKPEAQDTQAFEENWDKLRAGTLGFIDMKPAREVLQAELLARVASFQGTGATAFAVDIARLLDAVGGDATVSDTVDGLSDEVRAFIRPIAEGRLWTQLIPVIARLNAFREQIADFIEDFNKASFVADLQEVVRLLTTTGTMPSGLLANVREFERRLTEFQNSAIVDLVSKTTTVVESDREQIPKVLNALGSLDLGLIDRTMNFLTNTSGLIAAAEINVAREETNRSHADPVSVATEITNMLKLVAGPTTVVAETAQ